MIVLKDLTGKIRRFVSGRLSARKDAGRAGIPESCLHYYPVVDDNSPLVVFYSGDGGWARLTTHLSRRMQGAGMAVAGIDCMHYFWREKQVAEAADDLAALIREHGKGDVILAGYSMGADVVPCIALRLPTEIRERLRHIVLMSPGPWVQLKFKFVGWLGFYPPEEDSWPLLPDVEALAAEVSVSCYAGEGEEKTLVPSGNVYTQTLPGGHHYAGDYDALAIAVLERLGISEPGRTSSSPTI